MMVLGAGFGRTGTLSLKSALERLGFGPCYHMVELLKRPEQAPLWLSAADGQADWPRIFDGYQATVDWPGCAFWRELTRQYPQAKVILTVRDPERWWQSVNSTFFNNDSGALPSREGPMGELINKLMAGVLDGGPDDRERAITAFQRHNEEVQASVPAEQLLVFEVAQGWQPLCDFLGATPPDEPFPHVNDSSEFHRILSTYAPSFER
ncbi:hypothetical protein FHX37_3809 [Haloactinospora alba]|uniref:Sulfotransferase family protein n=1 Tax=Haloactinospora alba TaxID=405555 RepID=A0A543N9F6_9ACTN|nr:sulfotransferase family protein [Haloactinospora alba]TQN28464.1 hypothetical protein FHX37_3809 [Haloactinospora alba]